MKRFMTVGEAKETVCRDRSVWSPVRPTTPLEITRTVKLINILL